MRPGLVDRDQRHESFDGGSALEGPRVVGQKEFGMRLFVGLFSLPLPTVAAALILTAANPSGATPSFMGLGDLPGGNFESGAYGVSFRRCRGQRVGSGYCD